MWNVALNINMWAYWHIRSCNMLRLTCYFLSSPLMGCHFFLGLNSVIISLHCPTRLVLSTNYQHPPCSLLSPPMYQFDLVGSNCVCSHTCTPFHPHGSHPRSKLTDSRISKICSLSRFHGYHLLWELYGREREKVSGSWFCCGANLDDWPWNASWNGLPCVPLKWPVPGSVV